MGKIDDSWLAQKLISECVTAGIIILDHPVSLVSSLLVSGRQEPYEYSLRVFVEFIVLLCSDMHFLGSPVMNDDNSWPFGILTSCQALCQALFRGIISFNPPFNLKNPP